MRNDRLFTVKHWRDKAKDQRAMAVRSRSSLCRQHRHQVAIHSDLTADRIERFLQNRLTINERRDEDAYNRGLFHILRDRTEINLKDSRGISEWPEIKLLSRLYNKPLWQIAGDLIDCAMLLEE